jgi:hypothetical protein
MGDRRSRRDASARSAAQSCATACTPALNSRKCFSGTWVGGGGGRGGKHSEGGGSGSRPKPLGGRVAACGGTLAGIYSQEGIVKGSIAKRPECGAAQQEGHGAGCASKEAPHLELACDARRLVAQPQAQAVPRRVGHAQAQQALPAARGGRRRASVPRPGVQRRKRVAGRA